MTSSPFSFLPSFESEFATRISDSSGDGKHNEATITDATIQSLRSYVKDLEKQLTKRDRTIDKLREKVKVQETIIQDCLTELEARNVCDAKTVRRPRRDINAGPRRDAGPHNPVQVVPISITRVPRGRVIVIAPGDVSRVPRSSQ